jgi:catechol 2,3-dioxygenase-like lactoylglutathione lyase family enzyme
MVDQTSCVREPQLFRVILPVTDIEAAASFYARLLGMPGSRVSSGRHYVDCQGTILAFYDALADGRPSRTGSRRPRLPRPTLVSASASAIASRRRAGARSPSPPRAARRKAASPPRATPSRCCAAPCTRPRQTGSRTGRSDSAPPACWQRFPRRSPSPNWSPSPRLSSTTSRRGAARSCTALRRHSSALRPRASRRLSPARARLLPVPGRKGPHDPARQARRGRR